MTTTVLQKLIRAAKRALSNPRGPVFKAYIITRGARPWPIPEPTDLPSAARRVYIAPVNAAEQARRWADGLEQALPDLGARFMMSPTVAGSKFERDTPVPLGVFHLSRSWQRAEFERASQFTHVLVEAERPMFGGLFGYDVEREVRALTDRGVSVACIAHGSDIRNPSAHKELTPWSPFHEGRAEVESLQQVSSANRALLKRLQVPVFVVTPELMSDVPGSHWCPNVADIDRWQLAAKPLLGGGVPIVTHAPSRGWLKGSELIEPTAAALAREGLIDYRRLEDVPPEEMPSTLGSSDIVLEQFRIGIYSTTAIEAMAGGRVVVGHVLPSVREFIANETGLEVPVVEATPDTLDRVLRDLIENPDRIREIGEQSSHFARAVHAGSTSAAVLAKYWLDT